MSNCRSYLFLLLLLLLLLDARAAEQPPLAASTVVIYNKAAPDSLELAKFYAQQRGVPRDHIVGLTCSNEEEISREEYESTIAQPLRDVFRQRGWWKFHQAPEGKETVSNSSVQFAAIIKGIPLKIRPTDAPFSGDEPGAGPIANHNEACVDSEISVLALSYKQISGAVSNPYYQSFRGIREFENAILLLACRLDAPDAATVRRMITDAIAVEKNGLWGRAYIDSSHNAAPGGEIGDTWMRLITDQLRKVGVPVVYDDAPLVLLPGFPVSDCAVYYGWYVENVFGPFAQPDFRFVPGAVAVHIHSFSAGTLRDPNARWVAPLVSHGAAATMGNVYEPFLQMTSHLNIFNDRLLHGFTLAESGYMATQALSWMTVIVGDPLYRPYASWLQLETAKDSGKVTSDWRAYHDFALKNGSKPAPEYRALARQFASRTRNAPMIEDLGGLEMRDGNFSAATSYFQQARATYTRRDDILRVVFEETDAWVRQSKPKRAVDLIRSVLRIVSESPSAPLLRKIEHDLSAPAPASPR
jgi:uncharacterized protein (TIGR03790 family)